MGKMHRAQILLDPEQHLVLAEIAQRQGTSISEIVRSAVQEWLDERQGDELLRKRMDDIETIRSHHLEVLTERSGRPLDVDLDQLIDQMRAERGDELLMNMSGENK